MLMLKLNDDLIRAIGLILDFDSLLNYSIINKNIYNIFDESMYKKYADNKYGIDFWKKAHYRPIYSSLPLKNTKYELIRIENFQNFLDSLNIERWTQKDFYNYWEITDTNYSLTNKKLEYILNIY